QRYPSWGAKKIRAHLERQQPDSRWPAVSSIGDLLRREGLTVPRRRRLRAPPRTAPFADCDAPNAVWCIDFKGWFRTGDQGMLDADGYLTITGRLKEIINRGGEKVSPSEIDDVLMDHEAVAQAVTFAMPHDKLGEEVAAAVVLRDGADADERTLRDFAASRLTDFKVPRKIVFLDEIPKGATGKLQRIGLAEKLGL
ncbi:MAG: AMP-binding protein, partial [Alphaproteobacteria bacterium]|nr:AMP-binding protein [Alphaproteobacteria bacterium]